MATIKNLLAEVTFSVDLENVEVPEEVKEQLLKAHKNLDEIDSSIADGYDDAQDWLVENVHVNDGSEFKCEIFNIK